jgi:8-oxo-dGTP diphosphatase
MAHVHSSERKVVEKVFAYVTHEDRLLIFSHPNSPEAGLQVPAGTMEPGEAPERAVLREAVEESGLSALELGAPLGTRDFDCAPYGRDELHHRHFFHVIATGDVPETFTHVEKFPSHGGRPIPFDFFWVRIPNEVPELHAEHGALLDALQRCASYRARTRPGRTESIA